MRFGLLLLTLSIASCSQTEPVPSASEPVPASPVDAEKPAPAIDQGLVDAQAWLKTEVEKRKHLDVAFDRRPADLTSPVTIDFEYGSGHGGNLVLLRLSVEAEATHCEHLTYQEASLGRPKKVGGTASCADVSTAEVLSLLNAVRALSTASVTEQPKDWASSSSNDFFNLVRICRSGARDDRTWKFAGYSGTPGDSRYAAITPVLDRARELIEKLEWTPLQVEEFRRTHFSDAFSRNRVWYGEEFHWWVLERSLAALSWFGNRDAIPTLEWLRDHGDDVGHGRAKTAREVIDSASTSLEGPPPEMSER